MARKKDGDGATWERFFAAYVPRLASHGHRLWDCWRTSLLKDGTPGEGVVISQQTPDPHGRLLDDGNLFVNLESLIDDYIAAVDSLLHACESDDALRATVLRNWDATQFEVRWFPWEGPTTPGTIISFSASASSGGTIAVVKPEPE